MIKLFFSLFAFFIFSFSMASAEPFDSKWNQGLNYDQRQIGYTDDGQKIFEWVSTQERIMDDNGQYKNYIVREDADNVYFESVKGSYTLNKNSCAFHLYDGGHIDSDSLITMSHIVKEAPDGTSLWSPTSDNDMECNYAISENNGVLKITTTRGAFTVIYDIDYRWGFEWTYKYKNTNIFKANHKYGFTFVCDGPQCDHVKVNDVTMTNSTILKSGANSRFEIGGREFDTKNDVHDYFWALKKYKDKVIVDFTHSKGKLPVGETLVVDPTFGYQKVNDDQAYGTTGGTGSTCPSTYNNLDGTLRLYNPASAVGDQCIMPLFNFNIASLPTKSITISEARMNYGVSGVTNTQNCKWRAIPTNSTGQDVVTGLLSTGRILATGDTACQTTGASKTVTFNAANMTTYVRGQSGNILYIGAEKDGTRGGVPTSTTFDSSFAQLRFNYTVNTPNAAATFSGESQARKVQFTWTQTNGTGTTGYYIGRSLDNSTWPQANKTLTANVTSYLDSAYYRIGQLYYVNITATNAGLANSTSKYSSFTMDSRPSTPLNPYTTSISSSQIKLNYQPPSSNGGDAIAQYRIEACIVCTSWTLLSNATTTLNYNHTGLSSGQTWKYRVAAWNGVGISPYTANFTGQTYQSTTAVLPMNTTMVGDAFGVTPKLRMTAGNPAATITSSQLYRNGTLIDTDTYSQSISNGQTKILSNQYSNLLDRNYLYNHTIKITITNGTGQTQTFSNYTIERPDYTAQYYTMNGNQVNYTQFRTGDGSGLNLTVNRDPITFHLRCQFKNQLFSEGTTIEGNDLGYFNVLQTVPATQNVYVKCYNDALIIDFVSYGQFNGTLAILDYSEELGTFFGVPIIFMPIIFFAALFTGVSAPRGAIFLVAVIGIMGVMGFFPDGNGDPLITGATWSLLIFLAVVGLFIGKRWS